MSNPAPSTKIEEYLNAIRTWVIKQGFTVHGFALAAGLSPGTCRDMMTDKWNPRFETLMALESFIRRYTEHLREQIGRERRGERSSRLRFRVTEIRVSGRLESSAYVVGLDMLGREVGRPMLGDQYGRLQQAGIRVGDHVVYDRVTDRLVKSPPETMIHLGHGC